MNRTAVLLRNAPVLSVLSDDMLERVAADAKDLEVPAGEWFFREGEAAETMFIVGSGSVEVISERPQEALIGVLRRGEVLGELALLHEGTRSLSARARRGSRLLEFSRDAFERLIVEAPPFALALTRRDGCPACREPCTRRQGCAASRDCGGRTASRGADGGGR